MKSLAVALHGLTTSDSPPSESSPDLFALQTVAPTDALQAAVERMEHQRRQLPDGTSETLLMRAQTAIEHAHRQLDQAIKRDAIQATRPDGCWCLGAGGKDRRYMPIGEDEPVEVLSEYCGCPEGQARDTQDRVNREYYRVTQQERMAHRVFAEAGVPSRFYDLTFESYPVSITSRESLAVIREWTASGDESLLIYGPFGTGKTGLAVAAMRQRVLETKCGALFLTAPVLLDRIRQTYGAHRSDDDVNEADVLAAVRNTDLLVLDDLGAERPTDWVQEKLFTVINHRHDAMAPTIFTSNLDPEGLARHLGERIAWRIIEMSQVLKLDGPNLRDR